MASELLPPVQHHRVLLESCQGDSPHTEVHKNEEATVSRELLVQQWGLEGGWREGEGGYPPGVENDINHTRLVGSLQEP